MDRADFGFSVKRRRHALAACMAVALGLRVGLGTAAFADPALPGSLQEAVQTTPQGDGLLIVGSRLLDPSSKRDYTVQRLPGPNRLVVEFPDAKLSPMLKDRAYKVDGRGIRKIELVETRSGLLNAVRVVVTVDSAEVLAALQVVPSGEVLTIRPGGGPIASGASNERARSPQPPRETAKLPVQAPEPGAKPGGIPVPDGAGVVRTMAFHKGVLTLEGSPGTGLRIKNRFNLEAPKRLVLDVDNAVLASRDLVRPLLIDDGPVGQVRLGQFDERTVRIVVETPEPEAFHVLFPSGASGGGDRLLALQHGASLKAAVAGDIPADLPSGTLKSLKATADEEEGQAKLRLESSVPMEFRVHQIENRVYIDLFNVEGPDKPLAFDVDGAPFLKSVTQRAGTPNGAKGSSIVIVTKGPVQGVATQPNLSRTTLELSFLMAPAGGRAAPVAAVPGPSPVATAGSSSPRSVAGAVPTAAARCRARCATDASPSSGSTASTSSYCRTATPQCAVTIR